jgi:hypothetical protein
MFFKFFGGVGIEKKLDDRILPYITYKLILEVIDKVC